MANSPPDMIGSLKKKTCSTGLFVLSLLFSEQSVTCKDPWDVGYRQVSQANAYSSSTNQKRHEFLLELGFQMSGLRLYQQLDKRPFFCRRLSVRLKAATNWRHIRCASRRIWALRQQLFWHRPIWSWWGLLASGDAVLWLCQIWSWCWCIHPKAPGVRLSKRHLEVVSLISSRLF